MEVVTTTRELKVGDEFTFHPDEKIGAEFESTYKVISIDARTVAAVDLKNSKKGTLNWHLARKVIVINKDPLPQVTPVYSYKTLHARSIIDLDKQVSDYVSLKALDEWDFLSVSPSHDGAGSILASVMMVRYEKV